MYPDIVPRLLQVSRAGDGWYELLEVLLESCCIFDTKEEEILVALRNAYPIISG